MPMSLIPGLGANRSNSMSHWRRLVRQIDNLATGLESIDNDKLRKNSLALKYDALSGKPLDEILIDAFALVREAARRTIGMKHFEVQLLGGVAMHFNSIAVMQTGEGKTLTASLPLYLHALSGKGAHLATANDYLAHRDAKLMEPVFKALGLNIGVVQADTPRPVRLAAYQADVTYSTAKEVGFDFLRDRLLHREAKVIGTNFVTSMLHNGKHDGNDQPVQRGHNFMLVDEADSILIDEARTPLIVSSLPDEIAQAKLALYRWCADVCHQFELNEHYTLKPKSKQLDLNPDGRCLARKIQKPTLLDKTPILEIYEQIEQAIYVDNNYVRDRHYIIRDGEIVIVDEFTGRLSEGRKWRSGIHQAIEARENLEISIETSESARITIQDLFLKYNHLAGMTGTAGNSGNELRKIYDVQVVEIPTNKPSQREKWPDQVFATEIQKWEFIVNEIETVHKTGRPVLVGTRSIDKSELLSDLLKQREIEHQVLNARHLEKEADIIAAAGQLGRVTVATNMAGRGTDIKVDPDVLQLGGLHVICTELHESKRIDRQLIGRCGRQGDVGSFRQFMCLEDDILKVGLGEKRVEKLSAYKDYPIKKLQKLSKVFRQAQRKIENEHFRIRKMLLHREKLRSELQLEMGQDPYLDVAGAA